MNEYVVYLLLSSVNSQNTKDEILWNAQTTTRKGFNVIINLNLIAIGVRS